jgi:hypothetical protein
MTKNQKSYTAEDIEKNIQTMKDEGLSLDAPVEVTIEGDEDTYEVENMGHFHVVPNMTISLKLKNYVKKNGDLTLTLRNFLSMYNFKEMVNDRQNTQIVRVYTESPSRYIELGVNDWGYGDDSKESIFEEVVNEKLLDRVVKWFKYENDHDVFCIYLVENN